MSFHLSAASLGAADVKYQGYACQNKKLSERADGVVVAQGWKAELVLKC